MWEWRKQSSGGVLRNFAKFTGKHRYQSLFRPVVYWGREPGRGAFPVNFVSNFILKIRLWHICFPVNFVIFLRTHLLYRIPLDDCYWLKYFCKNISILDVIFSVFDLIRKERVNKIFLLETQKQPLDVFHENRCL